jgi:hypothetical protein
LTEKTVADPNFLFPNFVIGSQESQGTPEGMPPALALSVALLTDIFEYPIRKGYPSTTMDRHERPKDLNLDEASRPSREEILQTWVKSGIADFYLSFELQDKWQRHSIFYCHQGFEKVCKAYHIGKYLKTLKNFNPESSLKKIDGIAKSLNHRLFQMVKCLQSRGILPTYQSIRPYSEDDLCQALEAAYSEARYPVPLPFYRTRDQYGKERFLILSGTLKMYHDLLGETVLLQYARSMARSLLRRIEMEFAVKISDSKVSSKIDDKDWERFVNIFFKA